MDLKDKQASLTILGLQLESMQLQYSQLKQEIISEMNRAPVKIEKKKDEPPKKD